MESTGHPRDDGVGLDTRRMMSAIERSLFRAEATFEISRFVLGRKLGSGAMAAVYAAYDPKLDREIAVKILRHGTADADYARRLVREAEAMAAVPHPNVLTVYEAGVFDGQPYIAMELVAGGTLGDWQKQPHSTDEILAMYLAAAEGLHAAHEAGLVHRDFKPANVLVGHDGRARVADFGLARVGGPRSPSASAPRSRSVRELTASMTTTGTIVGTPAYMSPEQHEGHAATQASDQFSFCVALFEALYGERPFAGRTVVELADAIRSGTLRTSSSRTVPRHVHRALLRGLALEPRDRHPSMRSLVAQLRRPNTTRWRAFVASAIVGGAAFVWLSSRGETHECNPDARVDAIWNESRMQTLRTQLDADGDPASWQRTERDVTDYLAQWSATYRDACHGLADEAELDPVMRCLDRRLEQVAAVLELLTSERAAKPEDLSARRLFDPIEDCRDPEYLEGRGRRSSDPEHDRAVRRAETELARVRTSYQLGRFAAATAAAAELRTSVEALGDDRLLAETALLLGSAQERDGHADEAEAVLAEAFTLARSVGADRIAMQAATRLVYSLATNSARIEAAKQWVQHAAALQVDDPELSFEFKNSRAALELGIDRYAAALELYEQNLRDYEAIFGDDTHRLGTLHSNIAMALLGIREDRRALEHAREAMAIHEQNLGPDHPEVAVALVNLALAHTNLGEHDPAHASLARALEIRRKAFGEQHPRVAALLSRMARNALNRGDRERAIELGREALAMAEAAYGPSHLATADAAADLADLYRAQGRAAEARPLLERALVIETETLGHQHRRRAITLNTLATVLRALGELELGEAAMVESQAVMIARSGARSRDAAISHTELAEFLAASGKLERSRDEVVAALDILGELDEPGLGATFNGCGDLLRAQGHHAEALDAYRRAEAAHVRDYAPAHPFVAYSTFRVGLALEGLGRLDEAATELERAMEMRAHENGRRFFAELPETRVALARVELARGHRERASELARAAAQEYGDAPEHATARREASKLAAQATRRAG